MIDDWWMRENIRWFDGRLSAGLFPALPHRLHHTADFFRILAAFRLHRAADVQAVGAAVFGLVYIFQGNASGQKKRFLERIDTPEKNWKFSSSEERPSIYRNSSSFASASIQPAYFLCTAKSSLFLSWMIQFS